MSLASDALLAITGIFPTQITPRQHAAAETVLPAWDRRIKAWISGEQEPFKYVPPKDMETLWNQLAIDPTHDEVASWVEGIGHERPEDIADYYSGLIAARGYIVNAWPKFTLPTQAGPKILPLSPDDVHEMWSLIQVLDDPDRVLDEMESRTLSPTQAEAFRTAYPDLYAYANQSLTRAISARLAKDPEWAPGWEWEAVLRTLRGQPPETVPPPPPAPPKPDSNFKIDTSREQTQAEVSSAPKGSQQTTQK